MELLIEDVDDGYIHRDGSRLVCEWIKCFPHLTGKVLRIMKRPGNKNWAPTVFEQRDELAH